ALTGERCPRRRHSCACPEHPTPPVRRDDVTPAAVVQAYQVAGSISAAAKALGCCRATARKRFAEAGSPFARQEFDHDEAERLYRAGYSLREIGEHFGVGHMAVHRALRKRGVP